MSPVIYNFFTKMTTNQAAMWAGGFFFFLANTNIFCRKTAPPAFYEVPGGDDHH